MVYCKIFCKWVDLVILAMWVVTDFSAERIEMTAHSISRLKLSFFGMPMWKGDGSHDDIGVHEIWSYGTLRKYMTLFLVSHGVFGLAYVHLD